MKVVSCSSELCTAAGQALEFGGAFWPPWGWTMTLKGKIHCPECTALLKRGDSKAKQTERFTRPEVTA